MPELSKQQMVMESMREYLRYLAMETYHDAVESGDYNHYRDDPTLELADLYSDLWDDRKYLLAKAFFILLEPYRREVREFVIGAPSPFDQMTADENAMKKIFD